MTITSAQALLRSMLCQYARPLPRSASGIAHHCPCPWINEVRCLLDYNAAAALLLIWIMFNLLVRKKWPDYDKQAKPTKWTLRTYHCTQQLSDTVDLSFSGHSRPLACRMVEGRKWYDV